MENKYEVVIGKLKAAGVESEDSLKMVKEKLESVGLGDYYDVVRKNWKHDKVYYDDMELSPEGDVEIVVPDNYSFDEDTDLRRKCCNRPILDGVCPLCKQKRGKYLDKTIHSKKEEKIKVTKKQVETELKKVHNFIPY